MLLKSAPDAESRPPLTIADMQDIANELAGLAEGIQDEALRAKLERVYSRLTVPRLCDRRLGQVALTRREIDVLAQVALGHSNQQVADNLGLRPSTTKSYLKAAMRKLNAHNRVQATVAAREAGLIR